MDRSTVTAAAAWYAQLASEDATDADRQAWARWLEAHPDHARAWRHVEAMQGRMQVLPAGISAATLRIADSHRHALNRRTLLRAVPLAVLGGAALWSASRVSLVRQWSSDYRTAIGEQLETRLTDDSLLTLNTASAVDIMLSIKKKLVRLHTGEILIQTGHDAAARPFIVETQQGRVRALGTRFTVRTQGDSTSVAVLADAAEVHCADESHSAILKSGERTRFDRESIETPMADEGMQAEWTDGLLVISDWRLADFVTELARYRSERLSCDPAVANLRISGAFPLRDIDKALDAVARALPVTIERRTRLWGAVTDLRLIAHRV